MKETMTVDASEMDVVADRLDAHGWVNLQPGVAEEHLPPPPSSLFGLFSSRGPAVPLCTWHAGERSAGVQHATGPKVVNRVDVPPGWRVVQDHPRRGLVLRVPPDVPDVEVLRWLVGVGERLCPVPTTGEWLAELHAP